MKKILGILLAALMLLTLLPVTALAEEGRVPAVPLYYDTYINGNPVLASETDVFGDGTVVYTPATDESPAKLTLNNANLANSWRLRLAQVQSVEQREQPAFLIEPGVIRTNEPLEIELVGANEAKNIFVDYGCDLTIGGTGRLTIDTSINDTEGDYASVDVCPIYVSGNLTIEDAATVKATTTGGKIEAIYAVGDITINTKGTVTADATFNGNGYENAIYAGGFITIKGSSTVKAYADSGIETSPIIHVLPDTPTPTTAFAAATIFAEKGISINTKGTVTAEVSDEYGETGIRIIDGITSHRCAIATNQGDIEIAGGTVNASAGKGSAIYAGGHLTIKGNANVNAENDSPDGNYSTIYAKGNLTISTSGTVSAEASDNKDSSACAIVADGDINITSGTVKATASYDNAICAMMNLTIKGNASVEAYNAGGSSIWAYQNITINTIGSITATNTYSGSALGCDGILQIDNAGKMLLCGGYCTLYLSSENALKLAKGLAFYGSAVKSANENSITGETELRQLPTTGSVTLEGIAHESDIYTLYVVEEGKRPQLAQTVLLKGKDSTPLTKLADLIKAATSTFNMVQHLTNVAKMVSGGAARLVLAARTLSTLSRIFFHF